MFKNPGGSYSRKKKRLRHAPQGEKKLRNQKKHKYQKHVKVKFKSAKNVENWFPHVFYTILHVFNTLLHDSPLYFIDFEQFGGIINSGAAGAQNPVLSL